MKRARHSPSVLTAIVTLTVIMFSFTLPVLASTVAAQGIEGLVISPTFKIHLLVSPGYVKQQAAAAIANKLSDLGIQVEVVSSDWGTVNSRALYPSSDVLGRTYEQGGFDVLLTGWLFSPDGNVYSMFHSSQFPPEGTNYYLWNNTMADMLAYNMTRMMDDASQLQCVKLWQEIAYEELPSVAIFYDNGIVAFRPNFNSTPFTMCYYPRWPGVEQWSFISSPLTSVTVAQAGYCPYWGLSPYHTNYYSDITGYAPIYGELGSYGLLIRSQNSTLMEPYMAYGNYTMSADGKNWTFWIRPGIEFHNGEELDARDVAYTYRYIMTPSWNSGWYTYIKGILRNNSSVYWAGETGTAGAGKTYNKYEIHFDLMEPWAFFEQDVGGGPILPASVIVNSSGGIPDFSAWHPDPVKTARFVWTSFDTGHSDTYRYYAKNGTQYTTSGPIGAGPYKWVSYNPTTEILHLRKFTGYFNKAALEARGAFAIADYYVRHIPDVNSALNCLSNNSVQVLDFAYRLGTYVPSSDPSWGRFVSYQGYQVIEMGFNMRHPIWGTGQGTPLGQLNPSQAAEAAKHVRHAIEYLVPKDEMISSLLNGYGEPGLTPFITRTMPSFNFGIVARNGSAPNAKNLAMSELMAAGYTFIKTPLTQFLEFMFSPPMIIVLLLALLLLSLGLIRRRRRLNYPLGGTGTQQRYETRSSRSETATEDETTEPYEIKHPEPIPVTCPRCGTLSKHAGARYCMYCGTHLGTSQSGPEIRTAEGRAQTFKGRCMVCDLALRKSDPIVWCPYCRNVAHKQHLLEWLHVKDYCPVCRHHIDERDL